MVPAVLAALKLAPTAIALAKKGIDAIKGAKGVGGALVKSAPALTAAVQNAQSVGSTSNVGAMAGKAVEVVKNAASSGLLSKIGAAAPGIIGAVKNIAGAISTNDPEWFGEFKSAGATMNELIASDVTGNYGWAPDGMLSQDDRQVIQTNVSNVVQGISYPCGKTSDSAEANLLPTILADVRKAANNVLADDTHQYWEAYRDFAYLYEVYYSGMKLLEYSEHLPINIPAANQIFPAITPKNISQFRGMIESLGHYLKSTVKLPYALVAYIRWRFGTMFLSDGSDNTAMVSYSPQVIEWRYKDITPITTADDLGDVTASTPVNAFKLLSNKLQLVRGDIVVNGLIEDTYHTDVGYNLETSPIEAWISSIMRAQTRIAGRGRAPADIRLAYENMSVDYTVEHRHFDAKEANVRCNSAYFGPFESGLQPTMWPTAKPVAHNAVVVMNSALPMSEGIQSMCMSTVFEGRNCQDFTMFPVMGKVLLTPWSIFCETSINVVPKVAQVVAGNKRMRQILNGQGTAFAGKKAIAASNLEAGGFDPILGFTVPLGDLDCREAIIYGAGGCEVYTYFKNDVNLLVTQQLYDYSSVVGPKLIQGLTGVASVSGINADGVESLSNFATESNKIARGWHRFHIKSNFRDLMQAFYSPRFGWINCEVNSGMPFRMLDTTAHNQYGYYLMTDARYTLVYESAAQERVSVFDTNPIIEAHVSVPDTQFGNTYAVNSDSNFQERCQALMCCIGTHLINDYSKQLEIFHPGAGQMYSTFKTAADLENGTIFLTGLQSYDYATITNEQVSAIHRTAHRNLTRISLTQKTGAGGTQEAKDMTAGIIDAAIGDK